MAIQCANQLDLADETVAVALTKGTFGHHVGLVFRRKTEVKLLHLNFHKDVRFDDFPTPACWIAVPLQMEATNAKTLIGFMKLVGHRKPHIPFGVNIQKGVDSFSSGSYKLPKGGDGLTCATFINEICRYGGMPLVKVSSWEPRDDDKAWVAGVCELLKIKGADDAHIAKVRGNADGLRVRPEEAAAAADMPPVKDGIDFKRAEKASAAVEARLLECCPPLTLQGVLEAAAAGAAASGPIEGSPQSEAAQDTHAL